MMHLLIPVRNGDGKYTAPCYLFQKHTCTDNQKEETTSAVYRRRLAFVVSNATVLKNS